MEQLNPRFYRDKKKARKDKNLKLQEKQQEQIKHSDKRPGLKSKLKRTSYEDLAR